MLQEIGLSCFAGKDVCETEPSAIAALLDKNEKFLDSRDLRNFFRSTLKALEPTEE